MGDKEEIIPVVTRCNTCKAAFTTVEGVREHYRTDWHVFNSKRRASSLAHVTLDEYRRQFPKKKTTKTANETNTSSTPPTTPNLQSKSLQSQVSSESLSNSTAERRQENTVTLNEINLIEKKASTGGRSSEINQEEVTQKLKAMALELGVESERVETLVSSVNIADLTDENEDEEEEKEGEDEEPIVIEPNVSIFDDKEYETVEECLSYMERTFGFFIPEREYLTDLPGFLTYLGEKVKIGGICLYCQKQFRPGRPLQNHMMSKSHCKIAYQEEIDMDEYEDFYDFSSSYEQAGHGDEGDELVSDTLEISPIGELILTDGRCVGHRAFRRYYRQKHKPMDNRLAIKAQRNEEVLRYQSSLSSESMASFLPASSRAPQSLANSGYDLRRLSDSEIMRLLVTQHKENRRMQQIEERAVKRQEYRHKRAEYLSTKDQLRARINRTDKIRDYHGMLM